MVFVFPNSYYMGMSSLGFHVVGFDYARTFRIISETWIPYRLSEPADVTITIYNVNGQIVRRLELGSKMPDHYVDRSKAAYWRKEVVKVGRFKGLAMPKVKAVTLPMVITLISVVCIATGQWPVLIGVILSLLLSLYLKRHSQSK